MDSETVVLCEGRHVRLVRRKGWEYAERTGNLSGIVVVVSATEDARAVLVSQWREPVRTTVVEWPAGLAGDVAGAESESLEDAARRELLEETGYAARGVRKLWSGPPSAGLSNEVVTFFFASGLSRQGPGGGVQDEKIKVHLVPIASADSWLREVEKQGWMVDPKIWAGIYWLKDYLEGVSYD